ncbi:PREDICTED: RING finger protein 17 isoform X2 [Wasmannia auropunctata]|nr:PREDICTED: RING finger protein 17 isoform X2 [Wasmannia auropunctata]
MLNSCAPTCTDALSYYCNDCNVACCSNCILRSHKMHIFETLLEKNETLAFEFNEICMHIEETLMQIRQTKEKIKSAIRSKTYKLQNSEIIEASIAQHFAYLHGILQNMETKLLNRLHEQDNRLKNNLEEIAIQLRSQEERLELASQTASYVTQTFDKVDIRNAINHLTEMADLPCHLMYKDAGQNLNATLIVDDSIVAAIEDHCAITVPQVSSYSLVRKDELPKNYTLSPLPKKPRSKIFDFKSLSMLPVVQLNDVSLTTSIKMEDKEESKEEELSISESKVEITHVVNPSLFFVRKLAAKAQFLQLEKDLMTYGNDKRNLNDSFDLKIDDMCIVNKLGDKWYRARVYAVFTNDDDDDGAALYNVTYIDYGNEECNVVASRVREINEHLRALPPQAIRCSLHGMLPKNKFWTIASTRYFRLLTNGADCTMSVIDSTPDILFVDLCVNRKDSTGPQTMSSVMKMMDYARLNTKHSSEQTEKIYIYKREELMCTKGIGVNIGWIESPDEIYVTKAARKNKILELRDDLNEYYKKETSIKIIDTPQKGLPCAIQLDDDIWHRGEITEIINENQVKVFCVDWGCTSTQDRDTLRAIPNEYIMFMKAQAIRISLMYVTCEADGTWRSEAKSSLLNIFNNAKFILVHPRKKMEDKYMSCMYCDNIDISRQLKMLGVVSDFYCTKFKNTWPKKKLEMPSSANTTFSQLEKSVNTVRDLSVSYDETEDNKSVKEETATDQDPCKVEVRIQRVITPDCIYVAQVEHEQSNAKMISDMQTFYDSHISERREIWSEGALCAVYSPKDKSYFRAKILKINSPKDVLVYFYDMGIEETVMQKNIQSLRRKFAKAKTFCFKVKLAGILPCGGSSTWPLLSCDTLSEIIQDNAHCKFYITKPVQEKVCDDVISIELWVRQFKIPGPLAPTKVEINSINRMLVEKGVALPIKNYFAKTSSILAAEFKQQLESSYCVKSDNESVEWFLKELDVTDMDETIVSHKSEVSICNSTIDSRNILDLNTDKDCNSTNRKGAVKLSNWLPPMEITEEVFHAIPTYVDNKSAVYLHSKKHNADLLHYIETELQLHYKNFKPNKDKQWKEGEMCIARYHHDRKWYRGRVVQNSGNTLKVEFVDYGNEEDCEVQHVTDCIRLAHIPIQCTKCVVSGLRPSSPNGKWMLHDLDRIHALLVDHECKVSVLQRQLTHLIVSITLSRPFKCELLKYLRIHMEMDIKVEDKWNDSEDEDSKTLDSTRDVIVEDIISDEKSLYAAGTSERASSEVQDTTLNETLTSNLVEISKTELLDKIEITETSDTESLPSIDTNISNVPRGASTPQLFEEEENYLIELSYKRLIIPPKTKYIEIILCCNKDPVTSFAQLAENKDHIFSNELHQYYLQFETMMSEMQVDCFNQPLVESFAKNTPCVAKFVDGMWYRCIIVNSEVIPNSQYIKVSLYYVDYGNHQYMKLDTLSKYDLRVPKREWLELPAMAIKCTFWGLDFVSDDIDLLALKLDKIYNQAVVARIKEINEGSNLVVEIYKDKTCKKLFYADLIEEGLYQFRESRKD